MTELSISKRERLKQNMPTVLLLLILLVSGLSILLFQIGKNRILKSAGEAYNSKKSEVYQDTYNSYVSMGEAAFHTSNHVGINVGHVMETSDLEVLPVCATVLVHDSKENVFEEITGYSSFSVNLKAAEYMVDEERQTVYIRLPAPQLMEPVALDENSIHKYSFDSDGKITYAFQAMTGSVQNGEDEAKSMRHEASVQILNKLKYDVEYQHESKKAAISIISTLIRELNPAVDNLKVFVDFY